ncbi:MAG: hypothetical protein A2X64_00780 [Ignavibacteria bacterium GWF2_33_9]|nr:MAG: hypothetical protein A2X64_00780 [Ignavibacteria bacterium GWF2_33_9]
MSTFWDEKYNTRRYIYGKKPNVFFAQELNKLIPGKLLLPAEGEGRNAIFALQNNWEVVAFDTSAVARKKAERFAKNENLSLYYQTTSHNNCKFENESFDVIALIYAHLNNFERRQMHQKYIKFLKPGGTIILEAFSKAQINNDTGGPGDLDSLYSSEELKIDFLTIGNLHCWEETIKLSEGKNHMGIANIVRLIGKK